MEIWMVYSLIAMWFIWFMWFFQKIVAERKSINTQSFIFYSYWVQSIIWIILMFILGKSFILSEEVFIYGFLTTFLYISIIESRVQSLKYVDTSTYFIIYRVFSSILLLILGQMIFWELITVNEYVWIFLGFIIFYLLLEKKDQKESDFDFKKGIKYIFMGIILISIIQILTKNFVLSWEDIFSLFIVQGISGVCITILKSNKKEQLRKIKNKKDLSFLIFNGCIVYCAIFFNTLAFEQWDVAIVYKIISYSIFIPIILSIIFYKEKITFKKLLAFVLTIASIGLFV